MALDTANATQYAINAQLTVLQWAAVNQHEGRRSEAHYSGPS